jgi:DNA polymerase-1
MRKLREYTEKVIEKARSQGYVETLFGRRRYLPEITSNNFSVRSQAERMAVNMPIQGTAADLIKLAMIKIDNELSNISPDSRMIYRFMTSWYLKYPKLKKIKSKNLPSKRWNR